MRSRIGWPKRRTSACWVGLTTKIDAAASTMATTATMARANPFADRFMARESSLGRRSGLQRIERDIGDGRARRILVDDRLVHRSEHLLHRLQIHALAGHLGRLLVLVADQAEALGLALGVED